MATNRNDDMDRNRTNTPQGHTTQTPPGSPSGNKPPMGKTERDPVNRDREMNRDTEVGQGSSGSGQSGRDKSRGPGDISE